MNSVAKNDDQYIEALDSELDLKELFQTVYARKKALVLFVFFATVLSIIYTLKTPNTYKSEMILVPTGQTSKLSGLSALGGLAAMAGVNIKGASMSPDVAFGSLVYDYAFMRKFVVKNKIIEHYKDPSVDKKYVFAFGYRGVYDFFSSAKEDVKNKSGAILEEEIYRTIKLVQSNFIIARDKKTVLVRISYTDNDRTYPPVIIKAFLKDASHYLVENSLNNLNKRLMFFQEELKQANSVEIRRSLSGTISKILEQKVVMKSKQYYECDPLTEPSIAYIRDKTKPKRGTIVIVSFIVSIIFGILFILFMSFIQKNKDKKTEGNSTL